MFKPLHDYVLLEIIEDVNKTASGIIIPDNAKERPSRGKVIAIGTGNVIDGAIKVLDVKAGDVVLFPQYAASANEIKLENKSYIIIREKDILGILE